MDFLGPSSSPAGVRVRTRKTYQLFDENSHMPRNLKQVRALMSGIELLSKFLRDLSKMVRPTTTLLRIART